MGRVSEMVSAPVPLLGCAAPWFAKKSPASLSQRGVAIMEKVSQYAPLVNRR